MKSIPVSKAKITDAFWAPKLAVYIEKSIPHSWQYVDGELKATEAAARNERVEVNGTWGEANLYKLMETIAYAVALRPDPVLASKADSIIELVGRAQQPDGFVHAFMTNRGMGSWEDKNLGGGHDGYVQGHLIEAAVEYAEATGNPKFLEIAKKVADCAWNRFLGPNGRPGFCGHSEMELALVELFRATGEKKYLDLAKAFIDWHGSKAIKGGFNALDGFPHNGWYAQDHVPLTVQRSLEGHAVRALFFAIGAADVALETGDRGYQVAVNRLWDSAVQRRMYVTGSVGPRADQEAMGDDFELPMNGYNESCAACALADFAHRMFMLEKTSEGGDVLERVLYNAILHGIALDGCHSYYQNAMSDKDRPRDNNWTCCPPNLSRTLLQIGRYAYGHTERDIYINLYVGSRAPFALKKGTLVLETVTDYPWQGRVDMTIRAEVPLRAGMHLRWPNWCETLVLKVNGRTVNAERVPETGFIKLERRWKDGDRIELVMDMPVIRVEAHPNVKACNDRVAIQRGPIVYGVEGVDNGGRTDIELGHDPSFTATHQPDLLGGVTVVTGVAADGTSFSAIPYYALANRQPSAQDVWLKQQGMKQEPGWWIGMLYRKLNPATRLAENLNNGGDRRLQKK